MRSSLDILDSALCHEAGQLTDQAVTAIGKESPGVIACLKKDVPKLGQGRTVAFNADSGFSNANDATCLGNALILNQELCPFPCAQPTDPKTVVDEIKGGIRKVQDAQGIHRLKLHSLIELLCLCFAMSIIHHLTTDI